jgi:AraC family transcriptional regulator of adaptative response/methylated-DNA-[protein]-cysteine methyltransferase
LTALIEQDTEQKWGEAQLREIGIDPSTARRQFKARFGMSFLAYARARRLGLAAQTITQGDKVITAQMTAGYESASGFRRAFGKTFGQAPNGSPLSPLYIDWIDTPLGPMVCVCSDEALYLLEFSDRVKMDRQFEKLNKRQKRAVIPGTTQMTARVRQELSAYFGGELTDFTVPLITSGTPFQSATWDQLMAIPYGQTRSYAQLAQMIGNPKAVRAVAGSNANNGLAIIIPCHRVIATGGGLGGYAGSIARKQWLLDHEARHAKPRA